MNLQRIQWNGWDAVRCLSGPCELVVGISAGPRILSLRQGAGPNLLYQDTMDFRVGDWRLYGGHRFTVGPEGPESYEPDNDPCEALCGGDLLRITAPRNSEGMRRHWVIRPARDGNGFDLHHVLRNGGSREWHGVLWAITCVPASAAMLAPRTHPGLRFWPGTDPGAWEVDPGWIRLRPGGPRGKAGWYSSDAWIASQHAGSLLLIQSMGTVPFETCSDGGCNVEVFTCPEYSELETLGGMIRLGPGDEGSLIQRWRLWISRETDSIPPQPGFLAGFPPAFVPIHHAH